MQRKKRRGWLGTILLAAILATAAFAYTNTISFGAGVSPNIGSSPVVDVDGYVISDVSWVTDYDNVTGVNLTFDTTSIPLPTEVRVKINGAAAWSNACTPGGGDVFNCPVPAGSTPASILSLAVFAQG